jgi:MFS family permease
LLRNGPFVALGTARAISFAGDMVSTVALVLLVSRDHPATAVGGLLLAQGLPGLLSAFAGSIADRFDRRRLMILCQLGQGVIFGAITLWLPPYVALLGLVVLASLLGALLRAAAQTSLPALVGDDQLLTANALLGSAYNTSFILGPAIGGALAGLAGPRAALALDTATFLVSAATLLRLPLLPPAPSRDDGDSGRVMPALRYALRDPVLRGVLVSFTLIVAFAGVDNVALVFLVRDTLHASATVYGLAMAIFGLGMLLGTVLIVRKSHLRAERLLFGSIVATALGTLGLGLAPAIGVVFVAQIIGGIGNGVDVAAGNTLIQRRAPPAMLGRISGAGAAGNSIGFLVAYLGGGALVDATSPRTAFVIAAAGTLTALMAIAPMARAREAAG